MSSTGGKYHLATRLFSRPPAARGFSSFIPSFLGSSSSVFHDASDNPQYIRSLALGHQSPLGDREIWALGEEQIQKWVLKAEGWEEKVVDENLAEAVKIVLADAQNVSDGEMDLELLDLAINECVFCSMGHLTHI